MSTTFPEALKALKAIRAAKTLVRQSRAGAALREAWAAALEVVEADVLREMNDTNELANSKRVRGGR